MKLQWSFPGKINNNTTNISTIINNNLNNTNNSIISNTNNSINSNTNNSINNLNNNSSSNINNSMKFDIPKETNVNKKVNLDEINNTSNVNNSNNIAKLNNSIPIKQNSKGIFEINENFFNSIKNVFSLISDYCNEIRLPNDFILNNINSNLLQGNNNSNLVSLENKILILNDIIKKIYSSISNSTNLNSISNTYDSTINNSSDIPYSISKSLNDKIALYSKESLFEICKKLFKITNDYLSKEFKLKHLINNNKNHLEKIEDLNKQKNEMIEDILSIQLILLYSTKEIISSTKKELVNAINEYISTKKLNHLSMISSRTYLHYKMFKMFNDYIFNLLNIINDIHDFYNSNISNYALDKEKNAVIEIFNEAEGKFFSKHIGGKYDNNKYIKILNVISSDQPKYVDLKIFDSIFFRDYNNKDNDTFYKLNLILQKSNKYTIYSNVLDPKIVISNYNIFYDDIDSNNSKNLNDLLNLSNNSLNNKKLENNLSIESLFSICDFYIKDLKLLFDYTNNKSDTGKIAKFFHAFQNLKEKKDQNNNKLSINFDMNSILDYEFENIKEYFNVKYDFKEIINNIDKFSKEKGYDINILNSHEIENNLKILLNSVVNFKVFIKIMNSINSSILMSDFHKKKLLNDDLIILKNYFINKCDYCFNKIKLMYFFKKFNISNTYENNVNLGNKIKAEANKDSEKD